MLTVEYYNDGKEKYQSHEVRINGEITNLNPDVFSYDITDLVGYGANKEEALENLKKSVDYLVDQLIIFRTMLIETDTLLPDEFKQNNANC